MTIDSALKLKEKIDNGEKIKEDQIKNLLNQSKLVNKLLTTPLPPPNSFVRIRAYEWRLLELTEIPYTYLLPQVQKWLDILFKKTSISEGFSLTKNQDGVLACHNAMITTILLKMNYPDKSIIEKGIGWILNYQSFERDIVCPWPGKDLFERFGGCMKKTPCFYGIIKSLITLTEYNKTYPNNKKVQQKLDLGLEYILQHSVYKRLSTKSPIENSIIKNFYPFTYRSNVIEILALIKENDRLNDPRCKDALNLLKKKRKSHGFWEAEASYMKSSWIEFDSLNKPGEWISYKIHSILN